MFFVSFMLFQKKKKRKPRTCLIYIFKNYFMFSVLKNNENKENMKNTFGFYFFYSFFVMKNIKTLILDKNNGFQKTLK